MPTLTSARVAVVSGKGGVGKTTVAAALAVAAARSGRTVLIAEIEDRNSIAPVFGVRALSYEPTSLGTGLSAIAVDADEALVEYLRLFYGIPKVSRALAGSRAVEFATHTAPGLRDILLIGKIKEAERRRRHGSYAYDLVVLDAPPTGRLPRFLDAPRAVTQLVGSGPIRRQAEGVLEMVTDPARLQVVLVTQPEEMPIRETVESADRLAKMGVAVGPVVVNGMWPELGPLGRKPAQTLAAAAGEAGLELGEEAIASLATVATAHARRARNQRRAVRELGDEISSPLVNVPYLFTERIGRAQIDVLADMLTEAL